MPTRTEVIQGLRARDELQNRDLALFLDYLEEVAGASSGTRDTILSSRRRIQDEITPQDFERLYNYLAELGTPANTFAAFSRVIRRRDILSRQLANFIMDEIDAASFVPPPPGGVNPLFWYDFTTIEGLFQDTSLLTPVTASAQEIMGVANAGSVVGGSLSSQGKLLSAAGPDYITGGLNGLSYANFDATILESLDGDLTTFDWTDTAKALMCVFEYASGVTTQTVMHDTFGGGNLMKVAANSTPTFTTVVLDAGGPTFDPPVAGSNFSAIGLIDAIQRETRMTHDTPNISAGTLLTHSNKAISVGVDNGGLNAWAGRIYEVAVWGNGSVPTLDDLEAYVTNKYTLTWV